MKLSIYNRKGKPLSLCGIFGQPRGSEVG